MDQQGGMARNGKREVLISVGVIGAVIGVWLLLVVGLGLGVVWHRTSGGVSAEAGEGAAGGKGSDRVEKPTPRPPGNERRNVAPPQPTAAPGPVLHLSFDDGTFNNSGQSGPSAVARGALTVPGGVGARCAWFDGREGFAEVPYDSLFRFSPEDDRTIAFWWWTHEMTGGVQAFLCPSEPVLRALRLELWSVAAYRIQLADRYHVDLPVVLQAKRWYHVALVKSGTDWQLYHNGKLLTNLIPEKWPFKGDPTQKLPVWIGHNHKKQFFYGAMDEIRVFDRALSKTEITGLCREVPAAPTVPPATRPPQPAPSTAKQEPRVSEPPSLVPKPLPPPTPAPQEVVAERPTAAGSSGQLAVDAAVKPGMVGRIGALVTKAMPVRHRIQVWALPPDVGGPGAYRVFIQHAAAGEGGGFMSCAWTDTDSDGVPDTEIASSKPQTVEHAGDWSVWEFETDATSIFVGNRLAGEARIYYVRDAGYTGLDNDLYYSRTAGQPPKAKTGARNTNIRVLKLK